MKKRMIATLVLAALLLTLFAACGNKNAITSEEAQKIALKDAGFSASQVDDIHTHVATSANIPCYSIHITVGNTQYGYLIDAATGEILESDSVTQ